MIAAHDGDIATVKRIVAEGRVDLNMREVGGCYNCMHIQCSTNESGLST